EGVPKSVHPSGDGPSRCPQKAQNTHAAGAGGVQTSPQIDSSRLERSVERSSALLVTLGLRLKSARSTWVCEVSVDGLLGRHTAGGTSPLGRGGSIRTSRSL